MEYWKYVVEKVEIFFIESFFFLIIFWDEGFSGGVLRCYFVCYVLSDEMSEFW